MESVGTGAIDLVFPVGFPSKIILVVLMPRNVDLHTLHFK